MPNPTMTSPPLALSVGGNNKKPCGLCGNPLDPAAPKVVGVKVEATFARVCETCARQHGAAGMWEFARGLDQIHAAMFLVDPKYRPVMVALALEHICYVAEVSQLGDPDGPPVVRADQWREHYGRVVDDLATQLDVPAHEVAAQPWSDLADRIAMRQGVVDATAKHQNVIDLFARATQRDGGDVA